MELFKQEEVESKPYWYTPEKVRAAFNKKDPAVLFLDWLNNSTRDRICTCLHIILGSQALPDGFDPSYKVCVLTLEAQIRAHPADLEPAQYRKQLYRLFAYDAINTQITGKDGQPEIKKVYFVSSFHEWFLTVDSEQWNKQYWYEVIRPNYPCHLHLDIEFPLKKGLNAHVDGPGIVGRLICDFIAKLSSDYSINVLAEEICELESVQSNQGGHRLDSCAPEHKFSRHVIFRCSRAVFKNTSDVGLFVKSVVIPIDYDMVQTDKGRDHMVDLGIYNKDRCFRVLYSRKLAKPPAEPHSNPALIPVTTRGFFHPCFHPNTYSKEQHIYRCLVTLVHQFPSLIDLKPEAAPIPFQDHAPVAVTFPVPTTATVPFNGTLPAPVPPPDTVPVACLVPAPLATTVDAHAPAPAPNSSCDPSKPERSPREASESAPPHSR
jgi:hypothetical protein